MSKLPFVSSNIPRDLRAFVDRVKEILSDTGNGRLVTADELIRRGIAGKDTDGQLVPTTPDEEPELGTPPAPTNLQASGALASIILSWDDPSYFGHAYTEVWGASTDDLGAAVLLGSSPGAVYVDTTGADTTRYYWIRFVNRENTIGPYNATGGTLGQTGQDPAYLLELLTGEITESQLYADLGARIDLVDAAGTGLVTKVTNLETVTTNQATQLSTLTSSVAGNTTSIQTLTQTTDGLSAKYTVKIDNNGYVTGFGLASTANNAVPFSEFAVRADNFYIASPSGPGIAPSLPFIVRTTPTTINGVTVPVGVYITDGFIQNGTITNAKIGNAAIDDAKIASVTAGKITAGSIGVGEHIQSSNYIAGSQGWRINGNGFAEFGAASIRGQLVASQIDTRNLTIKDAAGNILFGAGTSISTANISGLGTLATKDSVDAATEVTGLGTLATQNSVNWNTQLTNIPAFGGFAYINTITSANISTYIQGAAIGTAYIANGAITNALIANAAISSAKIGDGEITNAKIANAAITAAKIEDAAITSAKIGNLQVQSANIAELTVGTNKITNNAITDTSSSSLSSTVLANEPISGSNLNWKDVLTLTYTIQENNSLVQIVPSFEIVDGTVADGSSGDSTVTYLRGPQVRLIIGATTYAATTKIFSGVSAGSYTVKLQIAADFFVNSFIEWDPLPGVTNSTLFVVEYKK